LTDRDTPLRVVARRNPQRFAVPNAHQAAIIPMIAKFGGRIIDTAGDGILAEFSSVVNAVECAVAFQKTMAARNGNVEASRRMQYRIGINLGRRDP
jgi:adenylate cyclase